MIHYNLLRQACGLSQREAAQFHKVRLDTITSWCMGRNRASDNVLNELRALLAIIENAADHTIKAINGAPDSAVIELGYPSDDFEAQGLGFPSVGPWSRMAALVIAKAGRPVRLVPRGSTPATAAAIDAHQKSI